MILFLKICLQINKFNITEISRVDGIKDSSMNLTKSITSIDGQLSDLLIVFWISIVTISIRPEPELGVGVEALGQDWH